MGGSIGIYPNGLRVFRYISKDLAKQIMEAGVKFKNRRWLRFDGSLVAIGNDDVLSNCSGLSNENEIYSLGIRLMWIFLCKTMEASKNLT